MNTITFQNKQFKVRELELLELGNVFISTRSLNNQLIDNRGGYVSNEAIAIDESIFYYVEEREIELSDAELSLLLTSIIQ